MTAGSQMWLRAERENAYEPIDRCIGLLGDHGHSGGAGDANQAHPQQAGGTLLRRSNLILQEDYSMSDITKIKVDGEPESSYKLFPKNREFEKRAGGNAGSQSGVQPDWNQNDDTQPDYVKNRPFYESISLTTFLEEQQIDFSSFFAIPNSIVQGKTYFVHWDDAEYVIEATLQDVFGDGSIMIPYLEQADGLFRIEGTSMYASDNGTHTVAISLVDSTIKTIDEKFIPSSISNKMDTLNPVGKGSFSLNRSPNYTTGDYSFAEGRNTVASGNASHAEGYETIASGNNSHAEGSSTRTLGIDSHAEGQTTTSSGTASHAEGNHTIASGEYSHAEGNETKASSESQHVQGAYNVEDSSGTYAHIVGNGTSNTARSNAHTLDWSGNAWYAGTVEGKALILPSSTESSTKKFKITVDDSGTLTATEVT